MQLLGRLEIKSKERIIKFLNTQDTGRICSIDRDGFPQIIPMNFVYAGGAIYMHSHIKGEKLQNISRNPKVGFEVDKSLEFLPSYFGHPTDASQADTLYISVVIKGLGEIITDKVEKAFALNSLMEKYQPEGRYEKIRDDMHVLDEVAIIKIIPESMRGKYKVGQHMDRSTRLKIAKLITERNSPSSKETLRFMGVGLKKGTLEIVEEPDW
ncbi:MAG: pyridoxamine 5'-phosphate oxidase family protein [Thaumarchaeota archaeon]|nr:pyridoxamine 5'-phosphate oxidase family protein [Nitrososphaerota archaeon]